MPKVLNAKAQKGSLLRDRRLLTILK